VTLGLLRKLPNIDKMLEGENAKTAEEATNLVADAAVNALMGWIKKRLTLDECRIYATPHLQLANALGQGLQAIAVQKTLLIVMDTYEIVDRLECDLVLRMVIRASGQRVVWVIAGRANLADTSGSGANYSQGYRDVFSENLYVYPMSEFSQEQVSEYFSHPDVNVSLSDEEAESVKRFSLGIPFIVQQIAAMRQKKIPLAEIISPPSKERDDESPYEVVVRVTIQRFLRYCFDDGDKQTIYAIAMMRRPDNRLLQAMLGDVEFEQKIQSLKTRHSFVLIDGKIRLHEKLENFLQVYLRSSWLDGQSDMVRELSDRAIAYLEPRLGEWQKEFTDTAEFYDCDRIANGLLDLVQFKFWQDVEVGWRYAVPLFVESWQYNRDWQKQLLGVIEAFQMRFDGDSKKRLRIFSKDLGCYSFNYDTRQALLDELEKVTKRGWLNGNRKTECILILSLQRGRLLYELEHYSECLRIYLESEKKLPETALHLRKDLAEGFSAIGNKLLWKEDKLIASHEAQTAYQSSVALNPDNYMAWLGLGVSLEKLELFESAIKSYQQAINLDPKYAYPHNGLGNIYSDQGKYKLAIESYQQAIELDPKSAYLHNNLGIVYEEQGEYKSAIKSYQKAIELDPKYADSHSALGYFYLIQGNIENAKNEFIEAINLDPKDWGSVMNLGFVRGLQGDQEQAITLWEQGLELLTGNSQYERLFRALHEVGIGKVERGTNCLREILETEKPPVGILSEVLKDAEIMARFPTKLEGIDTVIKMLQQAIQNAQ
jgi:tetratricopeptide (TPR) repeat protein